MIVQKGSPFDILDRVVIMNIGKRNGSNILNKLTKKLGAATPSFFYALLSKKFFTNHQILYVA